MGGSGTLTPGRENEEKYPKHRFLAILATLSPEIGQMVKSTILAEFYGASFGAIFWPRFFTGSALFVQFIDWLLPGRENEQKYSKLITTWARKWAKLFQIPEINIKKHKIITNKYRKLTFENDSWCVELFVKKNDNERTKYQKFIWLHVSVSTNPW